jgi:hypothetical protein
MTNAERVRLSRWVNTVEAKADELLGALRKAPAPLPRTPIIDPELLERLAAFTMHADTTAIEDCPRVVFLQRGNGNQVSNRRRAMSCTLQLIDGARAIDKRTVFLPKWGTCHFAAYTHPKGAMISTPNYDDNEYGAADWHRHGQAVMFRDVGDGRCVLYVTDLEPLFGLRTIGHHGVTWENVAKAAKEKTVFPSVRALELTGEIAMSDEQMRNKARQILDYLNEQETRCTYSAFAGVIGVDAKDSGAWLGACRPEASWVVRASDGEPSHYAENDKHPRLYSKDEIIRSAAELERRVFGGR